VQYLKKAFFQGEEIHSLLSTVHRRRSERRKDKDRILHFLQDSFVFRQGQNVVNSLVFNVPFADSFEAVRLNLWPSVRVVPTDPAAYPEEKVFRPTHWSMQSQVALVYSGIDALVEMIVAFPDGKTRAYQNSAWSASQAFSFYAADDNSVEIFTRSEAVGALTFDPPLHLDKGSAVTLRITPLFSAVCNAEINEVELVREYKITGVLEGYKRQK
jgi:hypothetical protein